MKVLPALLGMAVGWCAAPAVAGPVPGLATTLDDFFQPGTQPNTLIDPIIAASTNCQFCHGGYDAVVEPYRPWAASMMGQSARDPLFYACLTIANQDAAESGEFCIRCHVPTAYLEGRSAPADGTGFIPSDLEGVNCHFCHRLVNTEFPVPGDGPDSDATILGDLDVLGLLPPQGSNSRFVVDPIDVRRGPFEDLVANNPHVPAADTLYSPFHLKADFCWSCHDVSNPLFVRQPDDTYLLDEPLGFEHPTHSQFDMFPLHRTYSEWKNSYYFTTGGVQHNGRFGGNHPTGVMGACQDCHMPDQQGNGCIIFAFPARPDVPQHSFIGSNTWGLKAVRAVDFDGDLLPDFPDSVTGLTNETVDAMIARNTDLLEKASDMALTQIGKETLRVRIFNQSGHKLPTGFPDGRRMWVNVKFLNGVGGLIGEVGAFDFATGEIIQPEDTKVYEIKLGVDAAQAAKTGLPVGETFHFVLANTIEKDNRIPPTGFSNAQAILNQMPIVGATYGDGQHWDDTDFEIPPCAFETVVTVYYQLVSREYMTFLRDTNVTDNRGQVAFDLWDDVAIGNRSAPVVMDMATFSLASNLGDIDGDGLIGIAEFLYLLGHWGPCPPNGECLSDLDCDGTVGINDFLILLGLWD